MPGPTAPACTTWKSGKPKAGFPLFHPAHATTTTFYSQNLKTKERKSAATRPPPFSYADFMLIFRLENARVVVDIRGKNSDEM
jgi:hypothetical protein